jgi:hypothetical protein
MPQQKKKAQKKRRSSAPRRATKKNKKRPAAEFPPREGPEHKRARSSKASDGDCVDDTTSGESLFGTESDEVFAERAGGGEQCEFAAATSFGSDESAEVAHVAEEDTDGESSSAECSVDALFQLDPPLDATESDEVFAERAGGGEQCEFAAATSFGSDESAEVAHIAEEDTDGESSSAECSVDAIFQLDPPLDANSPLTPPRAVSPAPVPLRTPTVLRSLVDVGALPLADAADALIVRGMSEIQRATSQHTAADALSQLVRPDGSFDLNLIGNQVQRYNKSYEVLEQDDQPAKEAAEAKQRRVTVRGGWSRRGNADEVEFHKHSTCTPRAVLAVMRLQLVAEFSFITTVDGNERHLLTLEDGAYSMDELTYTTPSNGKGGIVPFFFDLDSHRGGKWRPTTPMQFDATAALLQEVLTHTLRAMSAIVSASADGPAVAMTVLGKVSFLDGNFGWDFRGMHGSLPGVFLPAEFHKGVAQLANEHLARCLGAMSDAACSERFGGRFELDLDVYAGLLHLRAPFTAQPEGRLEEQNFYAPYSFLAGDATAVRWNGNDGFPWQVLMKHSLGGQNVWEPHEFASWLCGHGTELLRWLDLFHRVALCSDLPQHVPGLTRRVVLRRPPAPRPASIPPGGAVFAEGPVRDLGVFHRAVSPRAHGMIAAADAAGRRANKPPRRARANASEATGGGEEGAGAEVEGAGAPESLPVLPLRAQWGLPLATADGLRVDLFGSALLGDGTAIDCPLCGPATLHTSRGVPRALLFPDGAIGVRVVLCCTQRGGPPTTRALGVVPQIHCYLKLEEWKSLEEPDRVQNAHLAPAAASRLLYSLLGAFDHRGVQGVADSSRVPDDQRQRLHKRVPGDDFVLEIIRESPHRDALAACRTDVAMRCKSIWDFCVSNNNPLLPNYKPCRDWVAFRNGLFCLESLQFFPEARDLPDGLTVASVCTFHDFPNDDFDPRWLDAATDPLTLVPSAVRHLFATQHLVDDKEEGDGQALRWIVGLIGRLLYATNRHDQWQNILLFLGMPGTGKSEILKLIIRWFAPYVFAPVSKAGTSRCRASSTACLLRSPSCRTSRPSPSRTTRRSRAATAHQYRAST